MLQCEWFEELWFEWLACRKRLVRLHREWVEELWLKAAVHVV